jgi:hypothetical protein
MIPIASPAALGPLDALGGPVGLAAFFVVGLLGGAHCLGMCGPLVTLYADRMPEKGRGVTPYDVRQHALFNSGRVVSYTAIGALVGALGGVLFDAAALTAVGDLLRAAVGVGVGLAIVVVGLGYLGRGTALSRIESLPLLGAGFRRAYAAITARVDEWAAGPRIVALGGLHGLLPCPLLYPAYLYAFGTGSALVGGASLAAMGLGTFPTLLAYGTAIGSLDATARSRIHRALGAGFLVLGLIPLLKGLVLLGLPVPNPPLPMPTVPGG